MNSNYNVRFLKGFKEIKSYNDIPVPQIGSWVQFEDYSPSYEVAMVQYMYRDTLEILVHCKDIDTE